MDCSTARAAFSTAASSLLLSCPFGSTMTSLLPERVIASSMSAATFGPGTTVTAPDAAYRLVTDPGGVTAMIRRSGAPAATALVSTSRRRSATSPNANAASMTVPASREWMCTVASPSFSGATIRLSPSPASSPFSASKSPRKLNITSSSPWVPWVSGFCLSTSSGSPAPSPSAVRVFSTATRPAPPASTTPASRSAGSWFCVSCRASSAAAVAAAATSASGRCALGRAASAAARSTVMMVPSTGSAIARSTNPTALVSATASISPSVAP